MSDMPESVFVFNSPDSIGDLGFTVQNEKEGYIEYVRADLANPAPSDDELKVITETMDYYIDQLKFSEKSSRVMAIKYPDRASEYNQLANGYEVGYGCFEEAKQTLIDRATPRKKHTREELVSIIAAANYIPNYKGENVSRIDMPTIDRTLEALIAAGVVEVVE